MNDDWPDIPDTPEQRKLIEETNRKIKEKHPDLVVVDDTQKFKEETK